MGTFSRSYGRILVVLAVVLAAAAYVVVQLVRAVPAVAATASPVTTTLPGGAAAIAWPSQGEAAIGVVGMGLLDSHGAQTPTPLASVTKLMTAYLVLHDHPLGNGATGPNIVISASDVATYEQEKAVGDSVVAVTTGEQLSEQQALQALLIPSGDNIATLLAAWDAGSVTAFVAKMNHEAAVLGLSHTHYADASGVSTGSTSAAVTQVRLAMLDMATGTFRSIVKMAQVTLPVAGLQYNVNALLGRDGIIGVKTGFTTTAGGCFVFAARATVAGRTRTVVGAVLHQMGTPAQPSPLTSAFDASTALLTSFEPVVTQQTVLHAGQTLGELQAPWASSVALQATRSVTVTGLPGQRASVTVQLPSNIDAPLPAHSRLGEAVVHLGAQRVQVPLVTSRALPAASVSWRLTDV